MSESKHTPGPWENHKWNCEEHQISANGGTISLVSHSHSLVPEAEADANARLIAAAPDLLEACRAAILAIGEWTGKAPPTLNTAFEKCMAALAKATKEN